MPRLLPPCLLWPPVALLQNLLPILLLPWQRGLLPTPLLLLLLLSWLHPLPTLLVPPQLHAYGGAGGS